MFVPTYITHGLAGKQFNGVFNQNRNYNLKNYGYSFYVHTCKCFGTKIGKVGKNKILYTRIEINSSSEG